ncbi:MAG: signal peptidase II [Clostridia bacterium]|nr:signal peptidase II [Clostridia bacterium]
MLKLSRPRAAHVIWLVVFVVFCVVSDRIVKQLILENFALHEQLDILPGIFRLTYTRNTGGAFSAFSGASWLFHVFVPVAVLLLLFSMLSGVVSRPLGVVSATAMIGGAIGNYIDRLVYGYVVDMFDFYLIDFAVFNLADCYITVGCVLLMICVLFFPEEKKVTPCAN